MNAWQGTIAPAASWRGEILIDHAPGERQLLEAARRMIAPGWAALVIQFSVEPANLPRAHHRRIARALLEDVAQRHGGNVFSLRNGDVVLLCPMAALRSAGVSRAAASANDTLPDLLTRLLRGNTADPLAPFQIWPMPENRDRLLGYATERIADGGLTPLDHAMAEAQPTCALTSAAESKLLPDLLFRQTGVRLGGRHRIEPLYREIAYASAALHAEAGHEALEADPPLLRHFATRLETRVLAALPAESGRRGTLDPSRGLALHINLPPSAVAGDDFATLAEICRRHGVGLGVEMSLVDATAEPDSFAAARATLGAAGVMCVLDGVSLLAMLLTRPAALAADLVKLDWSPRFARLSTAERRDLAAAFDEVGRDRVVIAGADGEEAMQWGLAQGVRRFQGRHVEAMLAASRLAVCPQAAGCSLRQCAERASAVAFAGRAGCRNPALLDAGALLEGLS